MAEKLAGAARESELASLDGWVPVNGRDAITKAFQFDDFNAAFGFMSFVQNQLHDHL